jgi:hypothetical protein
MEGLAFTHASDVMQPGAELMPVTLEGLQVAPGMVVLLKDTHRMPFPGQNDPADQSADPAADDDKIVFQIRIKN